LSYVLGFARFWYDFIVGDSVTLALGATVAVLVGAALAWWGPSLAAEVVLPALIVLALVVSVAQR
jgi:hypothetical protein